MWNNRLLFWVIWAVFSFSAIALAQDRPVKRHPDAVWVETLAAGHGAAVTADHSYRSMVTLYIENDDGSRTPSGWSTRVADGAAKDDPFVFQPGVNLIKGWTEGVLQMKVGERALLHVPSHKGYGSREMGSPNGAFYIPAKSDLLFDIEILSAVGDEAEEDL